MNDKNFEKINVKIVTSVQQFTSVLNFSQFELPFLGTSLPKKHFRVEYYDKPKLKILILSKKYHYMAGFSWFQAVFGQFQLVLDRSSFQYVRCSNLIEIIKQRLLVGNMYIIIYCFYQKVRINKEACIYTISVNSRSFISV